VLPPGRCGASAVVSASRLCSADESVAGSWCCHPKSARCSHGFFVPNICRFADTSPRASPRLRAPKSLECVCTGAVASTAPRGSLPTALARTQVDCSGWVPKHPPVAVDRQPGRSVRHLPREVLHQTVSGPLSSEEDAGSDVAGASAAPEGVASASWAPLCHPKMAALASPPTLLAPEGGRAAGIDMLFNAASEEASSESWRCFVHRFPHSFCPAVVSFVGPRILLRLPALFHTRGCGLQPLGSTRS
jgi:hypothetical protein